MALIRLAVHGLYKPRNEEDKTGNEKIVANYSSKCSEIKDEPTKILYQQLTDSFTGLNNTVFASFIEDKAGANGKTGQEDKTLKFPAKLIEYLKNRSDANFILFNHGVLDILKPTVEGLGGYKGGYFIFAESSAEGDEFIDLFFIQDRKSINFMWRADRYDLNAFKSFDTGHLIMSCRINTASFLKQPKGKCIDFYAGDKERQFFYSWLAAKEFENSKANTEAVFEVLRLHPPRDEKGKLIDVETRQPVERKSFNGGKMEQFVVERMSESKDGLITLKEISVKVYGDGETLEAKLKEAGKTVPKEFKRYEPYLKKIKWISENAEEIYLKFPKYYLNDQITLGKKKLPDGSLQLTGMITINSLQLAEKIADGSKTENQEKTNS